MQDKSEISSSLSSAHSSLQVYPVPALSQEEGTSSLTQAARQHVPLDKSEIS